MKTAAQTRLATSWEMKDGGKEWIFHLRRDVQFHNGSPFNARCRYQKL